MSFPGAIVPRESVFIQSLPCPATPISPGSPSGNSKRWALFRGGGGRDPEPEEVGVLGP